MRQDLIGQRFLLQFKPLDTLKVSTRRQNVGSDEEIRPLDSLENYMKLPEAAKFLGRCSKTVRSYIDRGVLRARRFRGQGRSLWIKRDDLKAMKEMSDQNLDTSDLWDLLKIIRMRLHSMDDKLDFLMRVSGLDVSTLRDAKTESLLAVYDEVCDFLDGVNLQQVPHTQMESWAGVFLQFTEIEFERLVGPTVDMQPWRPFHVLCTGLMSSIRRKKGFATHHKMQQIYRLLDKARKQISNSALVFEEVRASRIGSKHVAKIADFGLTEDSLDRYIAAEAEKSHLH